MNPAKQFQTEPCKRPTSDATPQPDQPGSPRSRLDDEQLRRWAAMVAAGETSMPTDLQSDQIQAFIALVRQMRRNRFVSHIARCIALDMQRARIERTPR